MIFFNWLKRKDPAQARFDRLAKRLESPIERRFWAHAYGPLSALGRFTPQYNSSGYRLDFALTNIPGVDLLRVAIELYGYEFHHKPTDVLYDAKRKRILQRNGWQLVTFWGSEINLNCEGCVRETVELVREWSRWLR